MELASDALMTEGEFYDALAQAPGVAKVAWAAAKQEQGNPGQHYMERDVKVYVIGFPRRPLVFALSRHMHMPQARGYPLTVTACFKEPPLPLRGDAWRILMHVVKGRELFPTLAADYCRRALVREGAPPPDEGARLNAPPDLR